LWHLTRKRGFFKLSSNLSFSIMDMTPMHMMLMSMGGVTGLADSLDKRFNAPPGCYMKVFDMAETYTRELRILMMVHRNASRSELRHTIIPPVVAKIYKDWSPQKQEYIVWAGVNTWLGRESWEGLGEHCTKNVNKQGFMSGPGDRALFGWTVKEGNQYSSRNAAVTWSEDEEDNEDEGKDGNEAEDEGEGEKNEDGKEQKGKGKGKKVKTKSTRKLKIAAKAKEKAKKVATSMQR
jgi:hypothetical protein